MSAQAVIDSLEFVRAQQELQGDVPVSGLARLSDCLYNSNGSISYRLKGGRDSEQRHVLSLEINGLLHLRCQRCLGGMEYPLRLSNTLLLVRQGEKPAVAVADPDAPDYIEACDEMDVAGLIEDEILLCLPFSPRHAENECSGLAGSVMDVQPEKAAPAFSKLMELKQKLRDKH
jgi:uncharacterized protein